MKTSDKTLALNITGQHYEHLRQLAQLVELVTEQPVTENDIAVKLLLRSLAGFNIGASLTTPETETPVEQETDEQPEFEEEQKEVVEEEQNSFDIEPLPDEDDAPAEEKASPQDISAIVSSLQTAAEKKAVAPESDSPTYIEGLTGVWQQVLGKVERGSRIAIISEHKDTGTRATLTLSQELNQSGNVLLLSPNRVGDFSELLERFQIRRTERPKQTKVIHYLPQDASDWKRLMLNSKGSLCYDTIVFDTAIEQKFDPVVPYIIDNLEICENARALIAQVYTLTLSRSDRKNIEAWANEMDVVVFVASDRSIVELKNKFKNG